MADRPRLPLDALVDAFYPATEPTALDGRSSGRWPMAAGRLDRRLTAACSNNATYDPSDDDPRSPGQMTSEKPAPVDHRCHHGQLHDYDGNNDADDRNDKLAAALYLLTLSPEYQIKK